MSSRSFSFTGRAGRRMALLALISLVVVAGCKGPVDGTNQKQPTGTLQISRGNRILLTLDVKLAITQAAQAKGLMGVKSLPKNSGMAFLFSGPVRFGFFMKDTLIPLDIAFWNSDGAVLEVLQMEPCTQADCPLYAPGSDYVGAVEVNKGRMAAAGVMPGDKVTVR